MTSISNFYWLPTPHNSDLYSADILKLKIAKSTTDVATSALLNKMALEINYIGGIL